MLVLSLHLIFISFLAVHSMLKMIFFISEWINKNQQVAQLWQRPRELSDFMGVGQFEAKFSDEGLRFTTISTVRQGNIILQLFRWKFSHKETL